MPLPGNVDAHFEHLKELYAVATDETQPMDVRQKAAMGASWAVDQVMMGMRAAAPALLAIVAPKPSAK